MSSHDIPPTLWLLHLLRNVFHLVDRTRWFNLRIWLSLIRRAGPSEGISGQPTQANPILLSSTSGDVVAPTWGSACSVNVHAHSGALTIRTDHDPRRFPADNRHVDACLAVSYAVIYGTLRMTARLSALRGPCSCSCSCSGQLDRTKPHLWLPHSDLHMSVCLGVGCRSRYAAGSIC